MGQTLSEPITAKETSTVSNHEYRVAASSMQGWRVTMEDAHTTLLSVPGDPNAAFFAVYDGHGGANIAQYASMHAHKRIVSDPVYTSGDIRKAIQNGFLQLDRDMLNDPKLKDEMAGSTAISVLIKDNTIYCGNIGDSRAIASVAGRVQELSSDHKPFHEAEMRRIINAGGWVELNRVNGNLALSRALGDYSFKRNENKPAEQQIVTCYPDVSVKKITPEHEFILLACDGIWDVLTNQEVLEFVRMRIAEGMAPEDICEDLMTTCLAPDCQMGGIGCDNMTVVLICLLQGGSYDNLSERCSIPASIQPQLIDTELYEETQEEFAQVLEGHGDGNKLNGDYPAKLGNNDDINVYKTFTEPEKNKPNATDIILTPIAESQPPPKDTTSADAL